MSIQQLIETITTCSPQVAADLLRDHSLRGLLHLPVSDLAKAFAGGCGPGPVARSRGQRLKAALELALRLDELQPPLTFNNPVDVWNHYRRLRFEPVEHLYVLGLSISGEVMVESLVARGGPADTHFAPVDIIRPVLRAEGAYKLVMVHNHPGGKPIPSPADDKVTANVKAMCGHCGLAFQDHIIIGIGSYHSYEGKH